MNNKRSLFIVPVVLAVVVGALVMLTLSKPKPKPVVTQASVQAEQGVPVEVAAVRTSTVVDAISVTGQLAAESVTNLSTKVPGKVLYVAAREGASVAQGQVVIQLDDADARRQLEQAQAGVKQAQAGLSSASARLTQARTGAQVGDAQSQAAIRGARAALSAARARLQQVRTGARRQERAQAQNQVAIARATLDKAQADYDRYKSLFDQGAVAAATVDIYRTTLNVARAQYNSAVQSASLVEEGARSEEVRQAEAQVRQAEEAYRSAQANAATTVTRREDVRAAEAGVAQARANIASAQAAVGIARQNVENFRIRAPRAGSVTERNVEPGQYANPGQPLLTIVDLGTIYLRADISETEFARIKPGQTVNVKVDALGNRVWLGKVRSVVASADPQSRTFVARVGIGNPDRSLRPNMFARAELVTNKIANAMVVPKEAVIQQNGRSAVVRVVNGAAEVVPVATGLSSGNDIVVRSPALKVSDKVVVAGQQALKTGQKVSVA